MENENNTSSLTVAKKSHLREKNSLESEMVFKRNLDCYDVKNKKFTRLKKPPYAENWNGGSPMLCDSTRNIVYFDSSDSHSLVIGSTGSKKSRLIVMPTVHILADAGESMIISDPKAEIYQRTSGHLLNNGYEIFVINLRSPELGNAWNPLYIPFCFYKAGDIDKACELVNDIAYNLTLADISQKDPFWDYSAGDLLSGLILLLYKFCIHENLTDQSVNVENLLRLRMDLFNEDKNDNNQLLWKLVAEDTIIASALNGTRTALERTKASILCTFDEKVRFLVASHNLINMLSDNDFDIGSIRHKKSAVFLIIPDEKTTYHKIVSMFIKQSYEYLIGKSHEYQSREQSFLRINYILDEFSSLPPVRDFPSMISAARSRNIKFMLIIQSQHQLFKRYADEAQTIMANCLNWYFLTSRELQLLENISALCGKDEKGNPLLSVPYLQRFDKEKGECLILSGRLKPYISLLMDIDYYDKGQFHSIPFQKKTRNQKKILSFTQISINEIDSNKETESKFPNAIDLQKELEKKFDELFGSLPKVEENQDD